MSAGRGTTVQTKESQGKVCLLFRAWGVTSPQISSTQGGTFGPHIRFFLGFGNPALGLLLVHSLRFWWVICQYRHFIFLLVKREDAISSLLLCSNPLSIRSPRAGLILHFPHTSCSRPVAQPSAGDPPSVWHLQCLLCISVQSK